MSHSKEYLPVGRRGVGAAPVLGAAAQFYPPRMLKNLIFLWIPRHYLQGILQQDHISSAATLKQFHASYWLAKNAVMAQASAQ